MDNHAPGPPRGHEPARAGQRVCGGGQACRGDAGGRGAVAVLRGEAGIGKTALLQYLIESAAGFKVVRAVGVESEMELAYAAASALRAAARSAWRLPAPQREALGIVFGLSAGAAPDRFLVGLGVLSLFSEVSEERPLLCVSMTRSGSIRHLR